LYANKLAASSRHKHAADVDGDEDDVGPPVITHTFKGMQRTHTHTLAERESERKQDGEVAMMVANCFRLMLSDVRMPGMKKHSSARERESEREGQTAERIIVMK